MYDMRQILFDAYQISPSIFGSKILNNYFYNITQEFKNNHLPKKITELELCKRFEGDFEGVASYFFKQTKMNPEEDILKSHLPNLKTALEKFKAFVGRNYSKDVASILNLEGGSRRYKTGVKHVSWEYLYFNAVPFEVAVRNLNQLQLAIRIIESSCVQ
jgi:hypothetical protein